MAGLRRAETAGRLVRTSLRGGSSATRQRAFSPTDSGALRRRLSFGPAATFGHSLCLHYIQLLQTAPANEQLTRR